MLEHALRTVQLERGAQRNSINHSEPFNFKPKSSSIRIEIRIVGHRCLVLFANRMSCHLEMSLFRC